MRRLSRFGFGSALRPLALAAVAYGAVASVVACKSDSENAAAGDAGSDAATTRYGDVPLMTTIVSPALSAPVELVRDDFGIPHIHGATDADVAFAQGYVMASDRMVQMDLGRRQAAGTLAEVLGILSPTIVDTDVQYRVHHLRANAEKTWATLKASTTPSDQRAAAVLTSFAAGVNQWVTELGAGTQSLPAELGTYYRKESIKPWSEVDSLMLGELQAFELAYDADSEIAFTKLEEAEAKKFHGSADPVLASRDGFVADYQRFAPFDPTTTVDGWANARIARNAVKPRPRAGRRGGDSYLALLTRTERAVRGVGLDRQGSPGRGSNNWVVSGKLTATGNPMVANDTHLSLAQPAIFYLSHLESDQGLDVEGVQFPGIPLVILGMNAHVAWGGTVNYVDVTDVYRETVKDCAAGGGKCVVWKGQEIALVPRVETFNIGTGVSVTGKMDVTIYDVPHHGPILPRTTGGVAEPLGAEELSVRYTGHEPAPLFSAVAGLAYAKNVDEAKASLDASFKYGGQNWVMADDAGNILWTQSIRWPRRPKGAQPWKVLPGDGSADWLGDFDVKLVPGAKNPEKGFLVTANADPVGVTLDNDPTNEPEVDGSPQYLAADYDPGTRVGRITKRINELVQAGKKISREDMASIQADAKSEIGQALAPVFLEGARALAAEIATPGSKAELTAIAAAMSPEAKGALAGAIDATAAWTFDTPAGDEGSTPEQLRDSRATAIEAVFATRLTQNTVGDELAALGTKVGSSRVLKLIATLVANPAALKTGEKLWDDVSTPAVETRLQTTAKSVADALEFMVKNPALGPSPDAWKWGAIHTLKSTFPLPVGLDAPAIPRHGGDGTVDVAGPGVSNDDYTFSLGPAIRFVAELDPKAGPLARNATPGGEIFRKESPHFADLLALWAKNQTTDLAFQPADVIARAKTEQATHGLGRIVFTPQVTAVAPAAN